MQTLLINKSQLKKKIGVIKGMGEGNEHFKNTVLGYLDGDIPILIETNLNQEQWNRFVEGELTEQELSAILK